MADKTDIWMPLYIGDYLAATTHLGALESGAYLHLLMHQWKNGKLPSSSEALRRIARVDADAWSNAWAMLQQFFDDASGFPVQMRLESIRGQWNEKKATSTAKAKAAADKRWSKDAPSNAQAMPQPCPSPSSSSVKVQKPSRDKREANPMHSVFKGLLLNAWKEWGNTLDMPWSPAEGKQLSDFIGANPSLGPDGMRRLLQYRARSQGVNLAKRPCTWIANLTDYARGPLDKYHQPEGTNGATQQNRGGIGRSEQALAELAKAGVTFADRVPESGVGEVRAAPGRSDGRNAAGFLLEGSG